MQRHASITAACLWLMATAPATAVAATAGYHTKVVAQFPLDGHLRDVSGNDHRVEYAGELLFSYESARRGNTRAYGAAQLRGRADTLWLTAEALPQRSGDTLRVDFQLRVDRYVEQSLPLSIVSVMFDNDPTNAKTMLDHQDVDTLSNWKVGSWQTFAMEFTLDTVAVMLDGEVIYETGIEQPANRHFKAASVIFENVFGYVDEIEVTTRNAIPSRIERAVTETTSKQSNRKAPPPPRLTKTEPPARLTERRIVPERVVTIKPAVPREKEPPARVEVPKRVTQDSVQQRLAALFKTDLPADGADATETMNKPATSPADSQADDRAAAKADKTSEVVARLRALLAAPGDDEGDAIRDVHSTDSAVEQSPLYDHQAMVADPSASSFNAYTARASEESDAERDPYDAHNPYASRDPYAERGVNRHHAGEGDYDEQLEYDQHAPSDEYNPDDAHLRSGSTPSTSDPVPITPETMDEVSIGNAPATPPRHSPTGSESSSISPSTTDVGGGVNLSAANYEATHYEIDDSGTDDAGAQSESNNAEIDTDYTVVSWFPLNGHGQDVRSHAAPMQLRGSASFDATVFQTSDNGGQSAAVKFNGAGDSMNASLPTTHLQRSANGGVSVEARVYAQRWHDPGALPARVLGLYSGSGNELSLISDTDSLTVQVGSTRSNRDVTLASALPPNRWHHVRIALTPDNWQVWVNGELTLHGEKVSTRLQDWRSQDVSIVAGGYRGWVDDVVVRTLNASASTTLSDVDEP